jgi:hypothetical protein
MKKFMFILMVIAVCAITFASCEKKNEISKSNNNISENKTTTKDEINYLEAFKNNIGFVDENGKFISISQEQMSNYLKNVFELDKNLNFKEYRILTVSDSLDKIHYFLKTINNENELGISIVNELIYVENNIPTKALNRASFYLGKKTCECESISCASDFGCDASLSGDVCTCSHCFGDCKKKSTVTSEYYLSMFEK